MAINARPRKLTSAWKRLLAPVRYLRIRHDIKAKFDWGWPVGLTAATMLMFWLLPVRPPILSEHGFLKGIRDLIALFAAFYVVALAAVSTFSLETLDEPMEGTTPTLDGKDLSRREFVCFLFGYLSVLSFALFLTSVAAEIISPSLHVWLSEMALAWVRAITGALFTLGFWNMVITTLLGVWFLVERVHLRTPRRGTPTGSQPDNSRDIDRRAA